MVNALIVDDNLDFSKQLINNISESMDVRICKICTNGNEVLEILKNSEIDIIILDMIMPDCDGIEVLKRLTNSQKEKYKNSIIAISGDNSFISQLVNNPLVYDFIIKGIRKEEMIYRIKRLIDYKNIEVKKKAIINELDSIGYDLGYKGTLYLIEAILQMYIKGELTIDNLQKDIYPIISKIYHKTVNNVKCNINNATEAMYYRCDSQKLKEYFNFYDDIKPTTKTVIYTVLKNIR
ncbi:MAG: response regulator [Bacilli bacterium]|nr:response regulator [Bacilli bacterium]